MRKQKATRKSSSDWGIKEEPLQMAFLGLTCFFIMRYSFKLENLGGGKAQGILFDINFSSPNGNFFRRCWLLCQNLRKKFKMDSLQGTHVFLCVSRIKINPLILMREKQSRTGRDVATRATNLREAPKTSGERHLAKPNAQRVLQTRNLEILPTTSKVVHRQASWSMRFQ